MSLALAAALAAQSLVPLSNNDPDLRCLAAYLYVSGKLEEDRTATADDKSGVALLVTYYLGKLEGRNPDYDLARAVKALTKSAGYDETRIMADAETCNADVETWTRKLDTLNPG